jgi:RNA polymerase sigma-70 factor (ECF subfamily)
LDISYKEDRGLVEGFLTGEKKDYQTIRKWICQVINLKSWGLKEYAEDIMQDVLLKLYNCLKENKFEYSSSLKTYVYQITKFTCIDYLRRYLSRKQREVELAEIASTDNLEEDIEEKEKRKIFWRIYRLISQECRDLWKMVFWESFSYAQVAQRLNIPEGTVKSRFSRCKKKAVQVRKSLTEKENL